MTGIVEAFKALSLEAQTEAYPRITAAFNVSKEARRQELEQEIKALEFKPGEATKKPVRIKYCGSSGETWSGSAQWHPGQIS